MLFGLSTQFPINGKSWQQLSNVDFSERLRLIEDSKFVHELLREADESEAKNFIDDLFI